MAERSTQTGFSMPSGKAGGLDPSSRAQLAAWSWIAVSALAIAGVFALLIALSRVPGSESLPFWPLSFFRKGLILHVVFSFVIWLLAVFGALVHLATAALAEGHPRMPWLGKAALAAVILSLPMLFVPGFLDRGEPSLNNYIPSIVDPLFYAGLIVLGGGIVLAVVRLLIGLHLNRRRIPADIFAVSAGAVIFLAALICFVLALVALGETEPSPAFNETLFWGGGHVLQFLNTLLLVIAWFGLAGLLPGDAAMADGVLKFAAGWLLVMGLGAPFLYGNAAGGPPIETFTELQYGLAPPTIVAALSLFWGVTRAHRHGGLDWHDPVVICLVLSPVVFGLGGILGLFVDGADTRTPAHYHGVIAAITLAFMGLFFGLILPAIGKPAWNHRLLRWQVLLFAGGQSLSAIGLFLAGGEGAPRKVAGAEQGVHDMVERIGLGLNGFGALFAVAGGVLFIWTVMRALARQENPGKPTPEV
jgi:cytochrome c oxidase subunit 1